MYLNYNYQRPPEQVLYNVSSSPNDGKDSVIIYWWGPEIYMSHKTTSDITFLLSTGAGANTIMRALVPFVEASAMGGPIAIATTTALFSISAGLYTIGAATLRYYDMGKGVIVKFYGPIPTIKSQ